MQIATSKDYIIIELFLSCQRRLDKLDEMHTRYKQTHVTYTEDGNRDDMFGHSRVMTHCEINSQADLMWKCEALIICHGSDSDES